MLDTESMLIVKRLSRQNINVKILLSPKVELTIFKMRSKKFRQQTYRYDITRSTIIYLRKKKFRWIVMGLTGYPLSKYFQQKRRVNVVRGLAVKLMSIAIDCVSKFMPFARNTLPFISARNNQTLVCWSVTEVLTLTFQ